MDRRIPEGLHLMLFLFPLFPLPPQVSADRSLPRRLPAVPVPGGLKRARPPSHLSQCPGARQRRGSKIPAVLPGLRNPHLPHQADRTCAPRPGGVAEQQGIRTAVRSSDLCGGVHWFSCSLCRELLPAAHVAQRWAVL